MRTFWFVPLVTLLALVLVGCATTSEYAQEPRGFITKTMEVGDESRT